MAARGRANFECQNCIKKRGGVEFKIENLPLESSRCPLCGHKRGFKRLFDAINVSSRHSRRKHTYIDNELEPVFREHSERTTAAARFEKTGQDAMAMAWEKTSTEKREEIAAKHPEAIQAMRRGSVSSPLPATKALGAVPGPARMDSQHYTYPSAVGRTAPLTGNPISDAAQGVTNRRVVPQWVRGNRRG